jgi:hypothetical protein
LAKFNRQLYESTAARALRAAPSIRHPAGFEGGQSIKAEQSSRISAAAAQPPLSGA